MADAIIRDGLRGGIPSHTLNELLQFTAESPPNDAIRIGDLEFCRHPPVPSACFELHELQTREVPVVLGTYSLPVAGRAARLTVFARRDGRWQVTDTVEAKGIQFRVWTFPTSGSFLLVRHLQCADRIEADELSVMRVVNGRLVTVAKHNGPMTDYTVAAVKAGKMVIDYQRFPVALCNSAMGMRMQYRLTAETTGTVPNLMVTQKTPWLDLTDNYYQAAEAGNRAGMLALVANPGLLDAMPPYGCGPRTVRAEGNLKTGMATVVLAVSASDHVAMLTIFCRRLAGGRWVVSGVELQR